MEQMKQLAFAQDDYRTLSVDFPVTSGCCCCFCRSDVLFAQVYTEYRPVPLQHYIFPANGDGVYLVVDEKNEFREDNWNRALAALEKGVGDQALQAPELPTRTPLARISKSKYYKLICCKILPNLGGLVLGCIFCCLVFSFVFLLFPRESCISMYPISTVPLKCLSR